MTQKTQHTPGPKMIYGQIPYGAASSYDHTATINVQMHLTGFDTVKSAAEYVDRACNSHDALVEALEFCSIEIQFSKEYESGKRDAVSCIDMINKALALAKGE